jgi:hypothetical protein
LRPGLPGLIILPKYHVRYSVRDSRISPHSPPRVCVVFPSISSKLRTRESYILGQKENQQKGNKCKLIQRMIRATNADFDSQAKVSLASSHLFSRRIPVTNFGNGEVGRAFNHLTTIDIPSKLSHQSSLDSILFYFSNFEPVRFTKKKVNDEQDRWT